MKIAILGTRGIPNNYGGFEQFAENLSQELVGLGHDVSVCNPSFHPFKEKYFQNVKIIRKFHPERLIGPAANIVYDFLCLRDAKRKKFDVILECGYGSAAFSYLFFNTRKKNVITNMDGMEWHRSKWSNFTKGIIQRAEKIAIKKSKKIIADNICVKDYYRSRYGINAEFIPYGAMINNNYDKNLLEKFDLQPYNYHLLIARIEPENNIDMILEGILNSKSENKIFIIGDTKTKYGKYFKSRFRNLNIIFQESFYNAKELNSLRYFSNSYFHGHSIGGTNPSLLEAMASECFIFSHKNIYNQSVLENNAIYFKNSEELSLKLNDFEQLIKNKLSFTQNNLRKIEEKYSWTRIAKQYNDLFLKLL
ncbi:MAG: DUF1972 domain-containing protein [Bacteroidota bacterium]